MLPGVTALTMTRHGLHWKPLVRKSSAFRLTVTLKQQTILSPSSEWPAWRASLTRGFWKGPESRWTFALLMNKTLTQYYV